MKRALVFLMLLLMTLGWMALIYGFSAQTATESGSLSAIIAKPVTELVMKLREMPQEQYDTVYMQVDDAVRVVAHFSEYAVLGILVSLFCKLLRWRTVWVPWLLCTVFAATDEWHQYYSPGRAFEIKDIFVDAAGVIFGIILLCLIKNVWRSKHARRT